MEDRKFFEMLVLFCFTLTVGISLAGIGPVLPDLMCLWNVSLHTISFLFLIAGVGTLAAIVVSSLLMEKLPAFIVLAIITITRGLAMFLFPYTGGLALAGPVVFIYGTTNGLSAVGSLYTTNLLWPTRAETIHLIQSGVAIGATLSPLLEKPFLSDGLFTIMMQGTPNDNPKQQFGDNNVTFNSSEITVSPDRSMAMLTGETMLDNAIYTNVTFYNPLNESLLNATFDSVNLFLTEAEANNSSWCDNFSTFLDFPFILFGCIAIPVTVGLIICYRRGKNSQDHPTNPYTSIDKSTDTSQSCIQHMFVNLMCLFSLFSMAIVGCISNLLATFGTECALKVDLNTTSNMTSVFWIFYSLGRIVPYFFIDRVRTFPILSVSFVGMTAGVVMLFLSLYNGLVSLWISMILLGFFSGPHFSSLFTWTREYVCLSSKNIALLSLGANSGLQFLPLITGLLMDRFGPNSFIYSITGIYIIHLSLFIVLKVCTRFVP
ncbi:major facilitator superfamily domain-containing protein 4A-like [Haliotis cracherodii]|uniref:major facilitator superfamily domain-containing protein 4A-like n=1 Tax=Haliotis cracherodii TaxID=6455 RepID=UPI0039EC3C21